MYSTVRCPRCLDAARWYCRCRSLRLSPERGHWLCAPVVQRRERPVRLCPRALSECRKSLRSCEPTAWRHGDQPIVETQRASVLLAHTVDDSGCRGYASRRTIRWAIGRTTCVLGLMALMTTPTPHDRSPAASPTSSASITNPSQPFDWYDSPLYYDIIFGEETDAEAEWLHLLHTLYAPCPPHLSRPTASSSPPAAPAAFCAPSNAAASRVRASTARRVQWRFARARCALDDGPPCVVFEAELTVVRLHAPRRGAGRVLPLRAHARVQSLKYSDVRRPMCSRTSRPFTQCWWRAVCTSSSSTFRDYSASPGGRPLCGRVRRRAGRRPRPRRDLLPPARALHPHRGRHHPHGHPPLRRPHSALRHR